MKSYSDHEPQKIEAVGNGSYFYHYNIAQVEREDGAPEWECEEVIVWGKPTSNAITKAVIADRWPSDYEQKLVNEYNGVALGLYGAATTAEAKARKQAYKDFLEQRAALKAIVDADCAALGIR